MIPYRSGRRQIYVNPLSIQMAYFTPLYFSWDYLSKDPSRLHPLQKSLVSIITNYKAIQFFEFILYFKLLYLVKKNLKFMTRYLDNIFFSYMTLQQWIVPLVFNLVNTIYFICNYLIVIMSKFFSRFKVYKSVS